MEKNELGDGGKRVMLEEALEGEELSFILLTDGERYAPLVPTRDHKRAFDNNQGPNTGGMGAYSSDELLPAELRRTIEKTIVEPTIKGLAADGIRYQGFLYIGLMLTKSGRRCWSLIAGWAIRKRRRFWRGWNLIWPRCWRTRRLET